MIFILKIVSRAIVLCSIQTSIPGITSSMNELHKLVINQELLISQTSDEKKECLHGFAFLDAFILIISQNFLEYSIVVALQLYVTIELHSRGSKLKNTLEKVTETINPVLVVSEFIFS